MPFYIYQNPKTKEIKEIIQRMTEEHSYEENGIKWERVFSIPQARTDSFGNADPFNQNRCTELLGKTKNLGEAWSYSEELSKKREEKGGKDFLKEKTIRDYEKRTKKPHPLANQGKKVEVDLSKGSLKYV